MLRTQLFRFQLCLAVFFSSRLFRCHPQGLSLSETQRFRVLPLCFGIGHTLKRFDAFGIGGGRGGSGLGEPLGFSRLEGCFGGLEGSLGSCPFLSQSALLSGGGGGSFCFFCQS